MCFAALPVAAQVPDEFTNLKVFPEDIGKRELIGAMRSFSGALGVRCNYCHVGPDNLEGMDFATDKLETKRVARAMMAMSDEINNTLMPATGRESTLRVRCATCHGGVTRPQALEDVLAAEAEESGVDAAVERYGTLRDEHYGSAAYDFSAGTLTGLAETLARGGDMAGAAKFLELNVEHHPDHAYSHLMLGQVHMQGGDKAVAIAAIERALELEPDNEHAKRMLAQVKAAE